MNEILGLVEQFGPGLSQQIRVHFTEYAKNGSFLFFVLGVFIAQVFQILHTIFESHALSF